MAQSLPMQYFGRGAANIPVPRAVFRDEREEWFVRPSVIILILAISMVITLKITIINNKKLFKDTKTIILMPETPPVPEPTVKKKIPLIKVIKDAVKKSVEPKKLELKKIIPQKPKPKKIVPKKIVPKKLKPLKVEKFKIPPKKLELNKPKQLKPAVQKLQPQKINTRKPLTHNIVQKPLTPNKIVRNKLNVKTPAKHNLISKKLKTRQIEPSKIPQQKTVLTTDTQKPKSPRSLSAPKPEFNSMQPLNRSGLNVSKSSVPSPIIKSGLTNGPTPDLQQIRQHSAQKPTPGRQISAPSKITTAPSPAAPIQDFIQPSPGSEPLEEEMVIIKSSALGNSSRVKTLKRAIQKKATNMSEKNSPYRYRVKGYNCLVIIKGHTNKKVIIEFSPADAPFEVVSALERMLPR